MKFGSLTGYCFTWGKIETYYNKYKYSKLLSFVTLRKVLWFVNLARGLSQLLALFTFSFFPTFRYVNGNLISKFIDWNTVFVSQNSIRLTKRIAVAITCYNCILKVLGRSLSWNTRQYNSCFLWLPSVTWDTFQGSIFIRSQRTSLQIIFSILHLMIRHRMWNSDIVVKQPKTTSYFVVT